MGPDDGPTTIVGIPLLALFALLRAGLGGASEGVNDGVNAGAGWIGRPMGGSGGSGANVGAIVGARGGAGDVTATEAMPGEDVVAPGRPNGFAVEGLGNGAAAGTPGAIGATAATGALGALGADDDVTVTLAEAVVAFAGWPDGTLPASNPQAKQREPSQARPQLGQRCTVTGAA